MTEIVPIVATKTSELELNTYEMPLFISYITLYFLQIKKKRKTVKAYLKECIKMLQYDKFMYRNKEMQASKKEM